MSEHISDCMVCTRAHLSVCACTHQFGRSCQLVESSRLLLLRVPEVHVDRHPVRYLLYLIVEEEEGTVRRMRGREEKKESEKEDMTEEKKKDEKEDMKEDEKEDRREDRE